MTTAKKNTPALRFPEFDGEWTVSKIAKIFDIKAGGDIDKGNVSSIQDDKFCYPIYANAEKDKGLYGYSDLYKSENAVTIAGRGVNIGIAHARNHRFYPIVRLLVLNPKHNSSLTFFENVFNNLNIVHESTGVPQLTSPQIGAYLISYPTLPEQQKIADFLTAVDERIQQLTRKKELLEQYKKGVMQQLFSQQIRFKDDDGNNYPDWEEKRLREIGKVVTGNTPSTNNKDNYNGKYLFVSPYDLGNSKYIYSTIKTLTEKGFANSRLMPKGSVLFTCIGSTIGKMGFAKYDLTSNQQINAILPNKRFISEYLYYALLFKSHKIKMLAGVQAVPIINKTEFEKVKIEMPNSLIEQQKIADYLSSIDDKIALVNTELEQSKEFKKGLLQQMFV